MSLNLTKGQRIDLTKGTNIKKIKVALGWDAGNDYDLDTSAFVLNKDGKLVNESDVIFYNQTKHISGAISHSGDDRTGAGNITHSNDKEVITIDLDKVPKDRDKIAFVVTIFEAKQKNQNFGMVNNAFIRIVNADNNAEVMKYNLTEDYSTATALVAGEIYRKDNVEWKFAAVGNGMVNGLEELIKMYGLTV